jgi:hypothetical protein
MENNLDPGPFAPLVGYVGAIFATVYLILSLVRGRKQLWNTHDNPFIAAAIRVITTISGIGIVVLYFYATPEKLPSVISLSILFGAVVVISFLIYTYIASTLTFDMKVAKKGNKWEEVKTLGGFKLTIEALNEQEKKRKVGRTLSTQEIFAGSAYDHQKVWTKRSLGAAVTVLAFLYMAIMFSGTIGISGAGFALQVKLTKKAASDVLDKEDSPGLNKSPEGK